MAAGTRVNTGAWQLFYVMADESQLAEAVHLLRQRGLEGPAAMLAKAWGQSKQAGKKPRKRMIEVKLAQGGWAWLPKDRVDGAQEIKEGA